MVAEYGSDDGFGRDRARHGAEGDKSSQAKGPNRDDTPENYGNLPYAEGATLCKGQGGISQDETETQAFLMKGSLVSFCILELWIRNKRNRR